MPRLDPHSYADDHQPRTASFDWHIVIDFDSHVLHGHVTLRFVARAPAHATLDLDTRGQTIDTITDEHGDVLAFTLHPSDPVLGARLEIHFGDRPSATVTLRYRTAPTASALQWLLPEQTLGKQHAYLFSQCQAIHARSIVPCQDTPSIRQTYTATLDVPAHLHAVMAAAALPNERAVSTDGKRAVERFVMPQPIPPYLLAFAVGDLASRELSPRTRVWAEPGALDAAAWEFAEIEPIVAAAEALFGPYDWDRFDLLVMPPSFPYGGMENPRLTFLTPALLTGDRSQVNVVAHELAHSWTGNLVTNANAEHFWLNEGFTVFAERRILAATAGDEVAMLHAAIGHLSLEQALRAFASHPELTRLQTELTGIDPDEAFSQIPYEKGYLFLKTLEADIGRERFDRLLTRWLAEHRFGAAKTTDFTTLVEAIEPGLLARVNADEWLFAPGLPANHWRPESARLAAIQRLGGELPTPEQAAQWTPTEWQLYLDAMPRPVGRALIDRLDQTYALTDSKNTEVLVAWLTLTLEMGDSAVPAHLLARIEAVLGMFGRMKYLRPLYRALALRPQTRALAHTWFARFAPRYHPIAVQVVANVLRESDI